MATIEFLKQELAGLPSTNPLLELSGALYGGSSLVLRHGGALSISFTSKSPFIMRYVLSLSSHALADWQPRQALLSRAGHKLSFSVDLTPVQAQQLFSGLSPLEPAQLERRLRGNARRPHSPGASSSSPGMPLCKGHIWSSAAPYLWGAGSSNAR